MGAASLWMAAYNVWEALHGDTPLSGDALRRQAAERLRRANAQHQLASSANASVRRNVWALAELKGYVANLGACPDGTPGPDDFVRLPPGQERPTGAADV